MKGRILLGIHRFKNDRTEAISKNFVNLALCLSAHSGFEVTTIAPSLADGEISYQQVLISQEEVKYHSLTQAFRFLFRICRFIRKNFSRFDLINLHIASPVEAGLLFLVLPAYVRKKIILSIWQTYLTMEELRANAPYFRRNFKGNIHIFIGNSFLVSWLYRISLKSFSSVIVHNNHQKKIIEGCSKAVIKLIPNAVFPLEFTAVRPKRVVSPWRIGYLGHTKISKGIDQLVDIMAILEKELDVQFDLVFSDFGHLEQTRQRIRKRGIRHVTIVEERVDVKIFLSGLDLLLVPLQSCLGTTLSPNVLIEAISVGTPVAVPRHPELIELVGNECRGIYIDPVCAEKSVEKIMSLLNSPGKLALISKNQRAYFKKQRTLEVFCQRYKELFQEVVNETDR